MRSFTHSLYACVKELKNCGQVKGAGLFQLRRLAAGSNPTVVLAHTGGFERSS